MLGKRAQTEDFLGDLVPALVIIAIAMVIGSVMSSAHISTIEARAAVANIKLNSLDIFSLLHSPVDVGGYKDFSDLLMSLAEAYENRDDEFFKSSSLARMGSEYAECSKVFEDEMDRFFGGKRWTVSIFEIPALLGAASGKVPVLASEIFYAVRPGGPTAATFAYGAAGVYGVLIAVPSLGALYLYLRTLARSERYQVIKGKAYRPREMNLGALKWLGVAFVVFYLMLAVVLPLSVLLWASLMPVLQLPSLEAFSKLSLRNYYGLLAPLGGFPVIRNTVTVVVSVSLLVSFFSFMISWVVVRTQLRSRKLVDMLAMLPHAIPGLAFAFALAMLGVLASVWLPWLPLSGTLGIIMVAHLINRLPFATRIMNSALAQVHWELEESAQVCGSKNLTIMRKIVLPLVKPSFIYLAIWTAILSFQEVTMALFLSGPHNQLFSVAIWELWDGGSLGVASAGAVTMVGVIGTLMFMVLRSTGGTVSGAQTVWPRLPSSDTR